MAFRDSLACRRAALLCRVIRRATDIAASISSSSGTTWTTLP
jgi:hypothetical protein